MASHLRVLVSDTGIGIPPHFLPHVFDRFSQKDSTASRGYNGLGLGLAISKQLVELHGGTIEAIDTALFAISLEEDTPESLDDVCRVRPRLKTDSTTPRRDAPPPPPWRSHLVRPWRSHGPSPHARTS